MDRRSLLLGLAVATAGAAPAFAKPPRKRPAKGRFAAAAAYSAERRGVSTLVMRDGEVVFEDYPNEGGGERGWELASGTKSFCGIMAAMAVADGLLSLDERCADTLESWRKDTLKSTITIRHLLSLTSGIAGEGVGKAPSYAEAVEEPAVARPGEKFLYGPTPFQIFGEILRRKLDAADEPADPLAYLQRRVFSRLPVKPSRWRRGSDDNPLMPQGASFTARGWAKFGQYVLDGAEGVDRRAYEALFVPSKANPGYGLTWWLLRKGVIPPGPQAGFSGPISPALMAENVVMAAGAGDQRLYLCRKRGLVVVRQASGILLSLSGKGSGWSDDAFLKLVFEADR